MLINFKIVLFYLQFLLVVLLNVIINDVDSTKHNEVPKKQLESSDGRKERRCLFDQFECESGQCVHKLNVCDGVVNCHDGRDESDSTCVLNVTTSCKLVKSHELRVQCEFKGDSKNQGKPCDEYVIPWTTIKSECNVGFKPEDEGKWNFTNICQDTGKWLYPMPKCTFECGEISSIEVVEESGDDRPKKVNMTYPPWNAIIYRLKGDEFIPNCLGTLITPFSILTDSACTRENNAENSEVEGFYGKENELLNLKVSLGRLYGEYNSYNEEHPQYINVESIHFINFYAKSVTSYATKVGRHRRSTLKRNPRLAPPPHVLSVLVLQKRVLYNQYVRPICIDPTNQFSSYVESSVGNVFTWLTHDQGDKSRKRMLKNFKVPYVSEENCKKYLDLPRSEIEVTTNMSFKQICLNYTCDQNCPQMMRGAAITIDVNGKYYLFGVVKQTFFSANRRNGPIVMNNLEYIEQYSAGLNDIIHNVTKYRLAEVPKGMCSLPYNIGTRYSAKRCLDYKNCIEIPTYTVMDKLSVVYLNCDDNFTIVDQCPVKVCLNGKWFPKNTSCTRLCEPLKPVPSVETSCSFMDKNVSCSNTLRAGTVATSYCNLLDINGETPIRYNNTCKDNGQWKDSPAFMESICNHKCGLVKPEFASVKGDDEVNSVRYPWNAGIYRKWKNGTIAHLCGGTLITVYAVLSAAHCVENYENIKVMKIYPPRLRIGLGKSYREFNHPEDKGSSQLLEVQKVHIPQEYEGEPLYFNHDIAIFELKKDAQLNDFVLPACIDTNNKNILYRSSYGDVVSWGNNVITGKKTDTLKRKVLSFQGRDQCLDYFPLKDKKLLTNDKFCATYVKDEKNLNVRDEDIGSGITFKFEGRYYVHGIVTKQYLSTISMFTNITNLYNLHFLNGVLDRISTRKKQQM